jgi:hypothetical protein
MNDEDSSGEAKTRDKSGCVWKTGTTGHPGPPPL